MVPPLKQCVGKLSFELVGGGGTVSSLNNIVSIRPHRCQLGYHLPLTWAEN